MTKTSGFGSSWWLATVELVCAIACMANPVGADELRQKDQHTFGLEFQTRGFSSELRIDLNSQKIVFKKEPDFGDRSILRGGVPTGQQGKELIGFAWDKSEGKLYLDLNRNLDLTDDPNGVFSSQERRIFQTFRDINIELERDGMRLPYLLEMRFRHYQRSRPYLRAQILSGFAGDIELHGKRWYVGVGDNMDSAINRADQFIVRPSDDSLSGLAQAYPLNVPERVSFDGHSYDLSFEFQQAKTEPVLQVTFAERQRPMGRLNIQGKSIKRLVLEAGPSLIVLDKPEGNVSVPAGNYRGRDIILDGRAAGSFRARSFPARKNDISVVEGESTPLKIGGPLNHTVEVRRTGNVLRLDYKLVGVGDLDYQPLGGRLAKPPAFAIYRGAKRIASGQFEYG